MTYLPYTRRTTGLLHVAQNLLLAAALVSPLLVSSVALADTQCGDITCGKGFTCQSYAMPCIQPVTKDGPTMTSLCENTIQYSCVLASCSTDADCASDMLCYSKEISECSAVAAPACAPDSVSCSTTLEEQKPSCTTTTRNTCLPRYALPCQVASDCGDGFTCEPEISTVCSGSSGGYAEAGGAAGVATGGIGVGAGAATSGTNVATPAPSTANPLPPGIGGSASVVDPGTASGGAVAKRAPTTSTAIDPVVQGGAQGVGGAATVTELPVAPPPEETCTMVVSKENYCKAKTITCNTDADCPSSFTCQQPAVKRSCAVSSDGTTSCTQLDVALAKTCVVKHYSLQGDYGNPTLGVASTDSTGQGKSETGPTDAARTNSGGTPVTQVPAPTAPSASTGTAPNPAPSASAPAPSASSVTTPAPTGAPAAEPAPIGNAPVASASSTTAADSSEPAGAAAGEPSDSSGGCSMSNSKSKGRGLASVLLVALGFAAMRNRRRAQS